MFYILRANYSFDKFAAVIEKKQNFSPLHITQVEISLSYS